MLLASATLWGAAEKTLEPNTVWANDTTYTANRKVYEIRQADCPKVASPATYVKGHHFPRYTAFLLKGLRNVTLDFNGATLLLHGKIQPFLLLDCTNVTVKNVSVRFDRSPFTQGVIRGVSDRELRLWVDPTNFPCHVENGRLAFTSAYWTDYASTNAPCFCQYFDGPTRKGAGLSLAFFAANPVIDPKIPWAPGAIQFTPREENGEIVLASDRSLAPWRGGMKVGNYAVIGHAKRDHSSFEMADCRDITLRNYRIVNGVGMGIFPFHCHNVTLDGVKMMNDETSPSIIANSADGIHAFSCSGDFVVTNCVVEGTIDDALNVHSNFYELEKAEGNEIVTFTGLEPEGTTAIYRPGDRIAIHRGFTLDRTGEYTIVATRPIDEKHVAFTLDRPVGKHAKKDIIENLSTQCRLLISNSRFGKSNTHLRLQTRGGIVIDSCESELPFCLTGDMNYWFESSPCDTLIVRNSRFVGGHARIRSEPEFTPTPAHPYYHGDLLVENCTFDVETAVNANGAKSVTVKNCRMSDGRPVRVDRGSCSQVSNDAVADLSDEIQARLAKGERKIVFPKRNWTCEASAVSLVGHKDIEIDFAGGTLRVPKDRTALNISGCSRVTLKNLTVDIGAKAEGKGAADAVLLEGCDACILENIAVLAGTCARGIALKGCAAVQLTGCSARFAGVACIDVIGEGTVIRMCRIGDTPGNGVKLTARRAEIVRSHFEGIRCAEVALVTPVDGDHSISIHDNRLVGAGERWLRLNDAAALDSPVPGVVEEHNLR